MPGIKPAIQAVLTALNDITDDNGITLLPTVRVWNNQLTYERKGNYPDFAKPAAFVEVVNQVKYQQLGGGMQTADLGFNIHLVHEWYDAQDGTFEDDLVVFDVRDYIVENLSYFIPTGCNELIRIGETVDNDHDNLYHFIISFVTNMADATVYDKLQSKYTTKEGPTDLQLDTYVRNNLILSNLYTMAVPTKTLSTSLTTDVAGVDTFFVSDVNGNSIAGSDIAMVIKEIKPLRTNQFSWNKASGFLTITDPNVFVDAGETLFILYTQVIN